MKIGVCIKQVPDTETKIALTSDHAAIVSDGIKYIMSPYDEFAVEEAIKTKETSSGEVVVITGGPERATEVLRTALAMGADRAIHVKDDALAQMDNISLSKILAKIVVDEGLDLVFCGTQAIDTDNSQTVQALAQQLNWPHAHNISKFELSDGSAGVEFDVDGGKAIGTIKLPCVLGTGKALNKPRYATLPNIMKAKRKEIKELTLADFSDTVSANGNKIQFLSYEMPAQRTGVKMIEGDPATQASELVRLLSEEAKVL